MSNGFAGLPLIGKCEVCMVQYGPHMLVQSDKGCKSHRSIKSMKCVAISFFHHPQPIRSPRIFPDDCSLQSLQHRGRFSFFLCCEVLLSNNSWQSYIYILYIYRSDISVYTLVAALHLSDLSAIWIHLVSISMPYF